VGYDLGLQIEAAQNLLAGKGMATYYHVAPNFADPPSLETLTHFPSGYSLCVAILISLGLGVGMVVKVLGAAGTMLGWWGWGELARRFFIEGLDRGPGWKLSGFAIATFTPLLFTIPWAGTDLWLWAAVPWVLCFLLRASDESMARGWWFDGLAGVACGAALLMRYASLFLAGYIACIILWQSQMRILVLLRRWAVFGLGMLPAVALQGYINYGISNSPAAPGGLSLSYAPGTVGQRAWNGFCFLDTASYPWTFWLPGKVQTILFPERPAGELHWQLGLTFVGLLVLVLAVKLRGLTLATASRDPVTLAVGLLVAVPVTLWASTILGTYNYVADSRYYYPLVPLSIFVSYSLASRSPITNRPLIGRLLQRVFLLYLAGYLAMDIIYIGFLFVPGRIGSAQRDKLMAADRDHWPSMAVLDELSPARQLVMRLLDEQPSTLLLTSRPGQFFWDPGVDRSRLRELHCYGRAKYVIGPARIIIHAIDRGLPNELWLSRPTGRTYQFLRADCFDGLPGLMMIQRFPQEGFKVLETRVGDGERIMLTP
jgi:hypothetical protein